VSTTGPAASVRSPEKPAAQPIRSGDAAGFEAIVRRLFFLLVSWFSGNVESPRYFGKSKIRIN
jgi:hypothetical protein